MKLTKNRVALALLAALTLGLGFTLAAPDDYYGSGGITETAGTRIQTMIPGKAGVHSYVSHIDYKDGGTAHTITLMKKVSETTTSAAAAASATDIVLTADPGSGTGPGTIAASDLLAVKLADGTWHLSAVSSVSSLTITLSTAIPSTTTVLSGARVIFYGAPGDSVHDDWKFTSGSSSASVYFPSNSGGIPYGCLIKSKGADEPIVIDSNNASNAGTFRVIMGFYSRPSQ